MLNNNKTSKKVFLNAKKWLQEKIFRHFHQTNFFMFYVINK